MELVVASLPSRCSIVGFDGSAAYGTLGHQLVRWNVDSGGVAALSGDGPAAAVAAADCEGGRLASSHDATPASDAHLELHDVRPSQGGGAPGAILLPESWGGVGAAVLAAPSGDLLYAVGGVARDRLAAVSLSSRHALAGAELQLPWVPEWISACPQDAQRVAVGGPRGLLFVRLDATFEAHTLAFTPAELPAALPTVGGTPLSRIIPAVCPTVAGAICTQPRIDMMEATAAFGDLNGKVGGACTRKPTSGESELAAAQQGRSGWCSPVWFGSEHLVAGNASGQVCVFEVSSGRVVDCVRLESERQGAGSPSHEHPPVDAAAAASTPICITALVDSSSWRAGAEGEASASAIAACSDGVLRRIRARVSAGDDGAATGLAATSCLSVAVIKVANGAAPSDAPDPVFISLHAAPAVGAAASPSGGQGRRGRLILGLAEMGSLAVLRDERGVDAEGEVAVEWLPWIINPTTPCVTGYLPSAPVAAAQGKGAAASSSLPHLVAIDAAGSLRMWEHQQPAQPGVGRIPRGGGVARLPLRTGERIASAAFHPHTPLVALGTSTGALLLCTAAPALPGQVSCAWRVVHRERVIAGAITALSFAASTGADQAQYAQCLAIVGTETMPGAASLTTTLIVATTALPAAASADPSGGGPSLVRAFATLPGSGYNALCWVADQLGSATLFLGSSSTGHLLSLNLSTALPILGRTAPSEVVDASAAMRLRGRFAGGVVSLTGTLAASRQSHADARARGDDAGPFGDGVLFVATKDEPAIAVVPFDSFHLAQDSVPSDAGEFNGISTAAPVIITMLSAHSSPCSSVALAPGGAVPSALLLGSLSDDGVLLAWGISVGISEPHRDHPAEYRVQVVANTAVGAAAGGGIRQGSLAFAPLPGAPALHFLSTLPELHVAQPMGAMVGQLLHAAAQVPALWPEVASALGSEEGSVAAFAAWSSRPAATADGDLSAAELSTVRQRVAQATEAAQEERLSLLGTEVDGLLLVLRTDLRSLQEANANASENERLDVGEFLVDEEGLLAARADIAATEARIAQGSASTVETLLTHTTALKAEVWDKNEVCRCVIRPLEEIAAVTDTPDAAHPPPHRAEEQTTAHLHPVPNFPLSRRAPEAAAVLERLALLRKVELLSLRTDEADVGGSKQRAAVGVWPGLTAFIPLDTDYLVGCGKLAFCSDSSLQAAPDSEPAGSGGGPSAPFAPGSSPPTSSRDDAPGTDSMVPSEEGSHAQVDSGIAAATAGLALHGESLLSLLYHPAGVRTPVQKRMQIAFVTELVRAIKVHFNAAFERLRADKHEAINVVRGRHKRLGEILRSLGEAVVHVTNCEGGQASMTLPAAAAAATSKPRRNMGASSASMVLGPQLVRGQQVLVDPRLAEDEDPESVFSVTSADLQAVCPGHAALKVRLLGRLDFDSAVPGGVEGSAAQRALMEMMDGKVEGRDRLAVLKAALVREPWMDFVAEAEMTMEQRAAMAAYNARLAAYNEEKAMARNLLMTEMTKITAELKASAAGFQAKLTALAASRQTAARTCTALELYMSRLALAVQARSDMATRNRALENAWLALIPKEEAAANEHEEFKARLEGHAAVVAQLAALDDAQEKGFKDALKASCGAIDVDVLQAAARLFKLRRSVAAKVQTTTKVAPPSEQGLATGPLARSDCPEGYSSLADHPTLWPRLNVLRQEKLASEASLAAARETLAAMEEHLVGLAAVYERLKSQIDSIGAERDALASNREVATNDVELLVRLKMGLDEVASTTLAADAYTDAMMVPTQFIDAVNSQVRSLGVQRVDILQRILEFRRTYLHMQWEEDVLKAQEEDALEFFKDMKLLRAMGDVGDFVKGVNLAARARNNADAEVKRAALRASASQRADQAVRQSVADLRLRLKVVEEQVRSAEEQLEASATRTDQLTEQLFASTGDAYIPSASVTTTASSVKLGVSQQSSALSTEKQSRMHMFAQQSRMRARARQMQDEIAKLTTEAERLRRRNFAMLPRSPAVTQ